MAQKEEYQATGERVQKRGSKRVELWWEWWCGRGQSEAAGSLNQGLQGLVRLGLDGLGLEGLLGGQREVWLVVLGWSHGVLARKWHHWLLGDPGLLS